MHPVPAKWEQVMEEEWKAAFFPKGFRSDDDKQKCEDVREKFGELANFLQDVLPNGRYKAMCKSELEKAAALATKAFTHVS